MHDILPLPRDTIALGRRPSLGFVTTLSLQPWTLHQKSQTKWLCWAGMKMNRRGLTTALLRAVQVLPHTASPNLGEFLLKDDTSDIYYVGSIIIIH